MNQSSQPIGEGDAVDNASQLSNAVKIIRTAAKQDPHALIITFIHGWKHNSSKEDANVEGFKQVLNYLHKQYSSTPDDIPRHLAVVGVYISWRAIWFPSTGRSGSSSPTSTERPRQPAFPGQA